VGRISAQKRPQRRGRRDHPSDDARAEGGVGAEPEHDDVVAFGLSRLTRPRSPRERCFDDFETDQGGQSMKNAMLAAALMLLFGLHPTGACSAAG